MEGNFNQKIFVAFVIFTNGNSTPFFLKKIGKVRDRKGQNKNLKGCEKWLKINVSRMNRWVSAKGPKGYGFCLPRWGSRVRTPSRALFYCLKICVNTWVLGIFVFCRFLENWLTLVESSSCRNGLSTPFFLYPFNNCQKQYFWSSSLLRR